MASGALRRNDTAWTPKLLAVAPGVVKPRLDPQEAGAQDGDNLPDEVFDSKDEALSHCESLNKSLVANIVPQHTNPQSATVGGVLDSRDSMWRCCLAQKADENGVVSAEAMREIQEGFPEGEDTPEENHQEVRLHVVHGLQLRKEKGSASQES